MQNLFVYGTLQFPSVLKKLTGRSFSTKPAVLNDFKRCGVKGCDYPAIIASTGGQITGRLMENVDNDSLSAIDYFEGDEYEKREVKVLADGKEFLAFTYVWTANTILLEDRDWDKDFFENNFLNFYTR